MIKNTVRLHKLLAQMGLGSRRLIEQWITDEKITVNGKIALKGQAVKLSDRIQVNDKVIHLNEQSATRVIIYHKAEGEICSRVSTDDKPTVFAHLPYIKQGKWIMVGRLDVNTAGLLLFTNQGLLAHRLMHPRFQVERQYMVRVLGKVTEQTLMRLRNGVKFDEGVFSFKEIIAHPGKGINQWFTVCLQTGRYREVRRLWESQNCLVSRLIRIKHGMIVLPRDLRKSEWRELSVAQVQALSASVKH